MLNCEHKKYWHNVNESNLGEQIAMYIQANFQTKKNLTNIMNNSISININVHVLISFG